MTRYPPKEHQRKRNGQCYAACPACAQQQDTTHLLVVQLFADLALKTAFSLGVGCGIARVRRTEADYMKLAQSLHQPFRDLAVLAPAPVAEEE